jgi:hypothetical protein
MKPMDLLSSSVHYYSARMAMCHVFLLLNFMLEPSEKKHVLIPTKHVCCHVETYACEHRSTRMFCTTIEHQKPTLHSTTDTTVQYMQKVPSAA